MNVAKSPLFQDRMEHFAILGMHTASFLHEMNNHLATIVGTIELFRCEELDPGCREKCENLLRAQRGIVSLVREAGALASGRLEVFFRTEVVALADLLRSLREAVPGLSVEGALDLDVKCDPRKTQRALADIARNAWQAGANQVRVEARRTGSTAVLRIVDDGPGIPAQLAEKLFSPGATHGKSQGNGIGLFSARWILESMGGSLELERSDSSGTSFLVTLSTAEHEA